jgi:hypothetical protein
MKAYGIGNQLLERMDSVNTKSFFAISVIVTST